LQTVKGGNPQVVLAAPDVLPDVLNDALPLLLLMLCSAGVRPFLVCAVLLGVKFTPELYEKFITLQTSIHQTLCNKREAAAIGTHDISKLQLPLHYEALAPADIEFVPLNREKDATAAGTGPGSCQGAEADDAPDAAAAAVLQPGQQISAADLAGYFAGDKTMLRWGRG
jgi:hypothetical protein